MVSRKAGAKLTSNQASLGNHDYASMETSNPSG